MTGELYAVLGAHSILKADHPVEDPTAFDEGAAAAGAGDALAARLFSARSRITALGKSPDSTASYLSGDLPRAVIRDRAENNRAARASPAPAAAAPSSKAVGSSAGWSALRMLWAPSTA